MLGIGKVVGFFTGLPGKLLAILVAAGGLLTGLALMRRGAKREGATEEREKQREKADEVRDKMDKVPDAGSDDTSGSLHGGTF